MQAHEHQPIKLPKGTIAGLVDIEYEEGQILVTANKKSVAALEKFFASHPGMRVEIASESFKGELIAVEKKADKVILDAEEIKNINVTSW